jgi:hypothetical protein
LPHPTGAAPCSENLAPRGFVSRREGVRSSGMRSPFVLHARNVRFIAHYELRLGEAGGGRGFDQLVTGVMYAGARTRPVWQELAQDQPTPPPAGPARALSTQDDGHRHDDRSVNWQRPAIHRSAWKGNSANFALGGSQKFGT